MLNPSYNRKSSNVVVTFKTMSSAISFVDELSDMVCTSSGMYVMWHVYCGPALLFSTMHPLLCGSLCQQHTSSSLLFCSCVSACSLEKESETCAMSHDLKPCMLCVSSSLFSLHHYMIDLLLVLFCMSASLLMTD
jgi:hypothetical protein